MFNVKRNIVWDCIFIWYYAFLLIDPHYLDFCGMIIFRAVNLFDYQVKYNIVFFYQQAHMHCWFAHKSPNRLCLLFSWQHSFFLSFFPLGIVLKSPNRLLHILSFFFSLVYTNNLSINIFLHFFFLFNFVTN